MKKGLVIVFLGLGFIMLGLVACSKHEQKEVKKIDLADHWQLFSSESLGADGDLISTTNYSPNEFVGVSVPTTVFNAMVKQGVYKEVYFGDNLKQISALPFEKSWWYRNAFNIESSNCQYEICFEGINYKANIWLNGSLIADTLVLNNAFKMYSFDVSSYIIKGENVLAVEVFKPEAGDFSIGFVDWNPSPPDENMGIFRPVYINKINKVKISDAFVENYFEDGNYSYVKQNVSLFIQNYSQENVDGVVSVEINGVLVSKEISIAANAKEKITFLSKDYKELNIENPQLWWPHTLGESILYTAQFYFSQDETILSTSVLKYGIREIKEFFNSDGSKGFVINGEKISIRGAGWVDNMMLDNTHDYDLAQLEYVKSMNLNTIRLEGFWGKDQHLYETCDELGILIMVGWSCHWEWENYLGKVCDEKYGGILNEYDTDLMATAWRDQIVWLRNHPSIIAWFSGSDCIPTPELDAKYNDIFNEYDTTRIYLASAKEWDLESGNTGVKMRGPYAYVPPVYWFADTLYGGAFGFNTETGPGAQVPPIESIKKMIPKDDLWPINEVWDFHCGRNEFNDLNRYTKALNERYGEASSVEEYARKAQLLNYELMRPMFEAFSVNRYQATGVIQWMLNSAWPEMYWQLYDTYLLPNAAFYATKKAGEPLQAIYDYEKNSVYVVNDRLVDAHDVHLFIRVYDINSKLLFEEKIMTDVAKNTSLKLIDLPFIKGLSKTYFLDLRLENGNKEIASNFYWLSTKKDELDYEATIPSWYYHTPSKSYSDFTQLNTMSEANVQSAITMIKDDKNTVFNIELENDSDKIAFFLELRLIDKATGNSILPAIWSDNYISLLPHERRNLNLTIKNKYILNKEYELIVDEYNR